MKYKILMVCLGNICRSPLAEGILANKLSASDFLVDSAGTGDYHIGGAPDPRSIAVAKKYGIDISYQKVRQFKVEDFANFDKIYVMDQSNYNNVIALAPDETSKNKVELILNELFPNENVDVQDPYFGLKNGFENVYHLLDEVCEVIATKLQK